jgi:hypothetical protein
MTNLEDLEVLSHQKEDILGKEMVFSGNVRNNAFFNTPEFIVNDLKDVDVDFVIAGLEKK